MHSSGSSRQQSPLKWELGHPQPRPHLAHISTIAPVNFFSLNDNLSSGSVTWNRLYDPPGVGDTRLPCADSWHIVSSFSVTEATFIPRVVVAECTVLHKVTNTVTRYTVTLVSHKAAGPAQ